MCKDTKLELIELKERNQLVKELLSLPQYKKLGPIGIAIAVDKARQLGCSVIEALNGLHDIQGKIEMSSAMMNSLIRSKGHSITKDSRSDGTECILHGRRVDTGDTWKESFSLQDAKNAGLLNKNVWRQYPKDMLFNRALSRLARQLFPDVIAGCYVEGEIAESRIHENLPVVDHEVTEKALVIEDDSTKVITSEQFKELTDALEGNDVLRGRVEAFLFEEFQAKDLSEMPQHYFKSALTRINATRGIK